MISWKTSLSLSMLLFIVLLLFCSWLYGSSYCLDICLYIQIDCCVVAALYYLVKREIGAFTTANLMKPRSWK